MSEEQQEQRIGVKEAVRIAGNTIRDLYDDLSLNDLLLEEVRRGPGDTWLITMSFSRPPRGAGGIGQILSAGRAFKQVRIDGKTGEFMDMEIRSIPEPTPERSGRPGFPPA